MALTTDITPRIHLTPTQVLQDPQRLSRLKSTLLEGIFAGSVDEASATMIVEECLKICGGSIETLSDVLQTSFLMDHTPFYWVIINRDPTLPDTPPLLTKLLDICEGLDLNANARTDVLDAFFAEYDSDIYRTTKPYFPRMVTHRMCAETPFSIKSEDRPRVTVSSYRADGYAKATIEFKIPRFFSRLLADGEVYFEFLVLGRVWGLKAQVQDGAGGLKEYPRSWAFNLLEVWKTDRGDTAEFWVNHMDIIDPKGWTPALNIHSQFYSRIKIIESPSKIRIPDECVNLRTFRRNKYTSNLRGQLSGKIAIQSP